TFHVMEDKDMSPVIDSHIHIDFYVEEERALILNELETYNVEALIAVSNNLQSAEKVLSLAKINPKIKPAIGYHPEQSLPTEQELYDIHKLINLHHQQIVGIGEVGLPQYLRRGNPNMSIDPYFKILETFIQS